MPPNIVVVGLSFTVILLSFLLSSVSSAAFRTRWTELNQNGQLPQSECDLKMYTVLFKNRTPGAFYYNFAKIALI